MHPVPCKQHSAPSRSLWKIRGLQSWLLLFKRVTNTQPIIPQMFHAWESHNLIASLNGKCRSLRVEWIVSVAALPPSSVSSHTTVVCGQYFSPTGHQGKKVWLIAVGKNNEPETPCAEGPELVVRFYSQETKHISSLLIVLCFQKVMGLLPEALLLEFSSVLAELFLPLSMIIVLACRTRQHLILTSKPPFPMLKGHWWGTLWERDSFRGLCHVNSRPSNRTPNSHITDLTRKKRWNVKENLSQTFACRKTQQWYGAESRESVWGARQYWKRKIKMAGKETTRSLQSV